MPTACGTPAIDIVSDAVLRWARGIAQAIRKASGLLGGTSDADELRAVADLELVAAARAFDVNRVPPGGNVLDAFKGFCHPRIKWACIRAARQLRTGGTLKPSDRGPAPRDITYLADLLTPDGDPLDVADPRSLDDAPDPTPDRPVRVRKAAGQRARRRVLDEFTAGRRHDITRVLPADIPPEPPVSETAHRFPHLEVQAAVTAAELQRLRDEARAAEQLRDHLASIATLTTGHPQLRAAVEAELTRLSRPRTRKDA